MKTLSLFALIAIIVLGLSVFFSACGKGGNSNLTTTQGAQIASESVKSTLDVLNTSIQLSNLASAGGTGVNLPANNLQEFAKTHVKSTALNNFIVHLSPALRKVQVIKASAAGFPIAYSCATGLSTTAPLNNVNSLTVDYDGISTYTLTFNACLDNSMLLNGEMQISPGTVEVFTIGSSGNPFTVTDFASATSTTAIDMYQANLDMLFTTNTTSPATDTIAASGSFEEWDYVLNTHDFDTLTNLSFTSQSTTTMNNTSSNNAVTVTFNGSQSITSYASDTSSTVNYNNTIVFTNFKVIYKTAVSGTGNDYLNMNGIFDIVITPPVCFDGTFSIITTDDIQIDSNGVTQAGLVTVDSNAIVTFLPNEAVTVSIGGAVPEPITAAQLESLCAL